MNALNDPKVVANRLSQALVFLGYEASQPQHVRHNLLTAIQLFAAASNDAELESACEQEMLKIRGQAHSG